jgi:hypothetical protein
MNVRSLNINPSDLSTPNSTADIGHKSETLSRIGFLKKYFVRKTAVKDTNNGGL